MEKQVCGSLEMEFVWENWIQNQSAMDCASQGHFYDSPHLITEINYSNE